MSVRKPLQKLPSDSIDIDALINKGARVKEDRESQEDKKWVNINIRLSVDMLKNVDEALKHRVGIKRTGWILEAIQEKLRKDNE